MSHEHTAMLPPNIYAARSHFVIKQHHEKYKKVLEQKMDGPLGKHLPEVPEVSDTSRVCIIGAGAAGLYTALILDSLDIPYDILEANPDLIGGRLFTKYFDGPDSYNYYDVGAMRFPDSPFMKRVFDLIDPNRQTPILKQPPAKIPYIFQMWTPSQTNTFEYYNGIQTANVPDLPANPFKISDAYVDPTMLAAGQPKQTIDSVLSAPRALFADSKLTIEQALSQLYATYDQYSMRSWMQSKGYSASAINYCETLDKSTGWYDRALTETVLESLAFDWPAKENQPQSPPINWWCFDHGTYQLPRSMYNAMKTEAQMGRSVTAITETATGIDVTVSVNGQVQPAKSYAAVISTVSLSCLSTMDLSGCSLPGGGGDNYSQWAAIRQLQYGPAIKIGIKFTEPWWATLKTGGIVGGQSYTDLPLRTIVYPSYPETGDKSPVLIVSYCWTQDAERLSALINRDGTAQPELIPLVLRDLATVHQISVEDIQPLYQGEYFAWSWGQNKYTMGAYAFFGPQQFADSNLNVTDSFYANITLPAANGKLYIAGEATSSCHAWVAGAFDSSWRAVLQFLKAFSSQYDEKVMEKFKTIWGESEYWDDAMTEKHMKLAIYLSNRRRA